MGKSLGLGPPWQQGPKWAREPSDPWQQSGEPHADAVWRWPLASVVASANPSSASNPSPRLGDARAVHISHPSPLALLLMLWGGLRLAAPGCRGKRRAQEPTAPAQGLGLLPTSPARSPPPQPLLAPPAAPAPAAALALGQLLCTADSSWAPVPRNDLRQEPRAPVYERSKAAAGSVTPWDCCQLSATGVDQPHGPLRLGAAWGTNSPSSHCRESSTQTWPMRRMPLDLPIPGVPGSPPWQGQEQPGLATDQPPPRASRLGLLPSLSPAALALETPTQLTAGDAGRTGHGHGTLYCGAGLCSSGCAELGRCREGRGDQGDPHQPCHPQRHFGVPEESGSNPIPARPVLPSLSHSQSPPAHSLDAC